METDFNKMDEKKDSHKKKDEKKQDGSFDKLELSLYRVQLAIVGTATTMTTLGFAMIKLIQDRMKEVAEKPLLHFISARDVGLVLFFAGFVGLLSYTIRHVKP